MAAFDKTGGKLGRAAFLKGIVSTGVTIGWAARSRAEESPAPGPPASCLPLAAHPHHHHAPFQIIPARLSASASMALNEAQQADLDAMVVEARETLLRFQAGLTETQRQQMLFPRDAWARISGRDTAMTSGPFCAALSWCVPGWGLMLGSLDYRQRVAFEAFLLATLGARGYDLVCAIRNRQNLTGVLETHATAQAVEAAARLKPDREFDTFVSLMAGVDAAGVHLPAEATSAAAIGGKNPGSKSWDWVPPGMSQRWHQFQSYAIAVFGAPDEDAWALRLEGHHLSINLTFIRADGHWQVHGTPLFLGAFPIVVPPPADPAALADPLTWQQGQTLGLDLALAAKRFWGALPPAWRTAAWQPASGFAQRPPLLMETPPGSQEISLELTPDIAGIERGPHIKAAPWDLPAEARRQLAALVKGVLSGLHPSVAAAYTMRLESAFRTDTLCATWAGGDLADQGSQHFSSISLGPFLVELVQTPQYSITSTTMPWSNHLHVMLRDLASPVWGDPLGGHQDRDHDHA